MLIARALSPAELGVMAMALAVSVFADALIDFGLSSQVMRRIRTQATSPFQWRAMAADAVGYAQRFGYCGCVWLGRAGYDEPRLQWALWGVVAASWLNAAGLVPHALLSRQLPAQVDCPAQYLGHFGGGSVLVGMAHAGQGCWPWW